MLHNEQDQEQKITLKDRALDLLGATVLRALDKIVMTLYVRPEQQDVIDHKHQRFITPGRYREQDNE